MRTERKLTNDEAANLLGFIETRRDDFRHGAGCNLGCMLFVIAIGILTLSRLGIPERWDAVATLDLFLKLSIASLCLLGVREVVKSALHARNTRRVFERDDVPKIKAAAQAGDAVAYKVKTDEVILVEEPDEVILSSFVDLGDRTTLFLPEVVSKTKGVWPASEFEVVTSPHYPSWFMVSAGQDVPLRVRSIVAEPAVTLEAFEPKILTGTPEEALRGFGFKGAIS